MKKNKFKNSIPEMHRRQLLKSMGGLLASPLVPTSFGLGLSGLLGDEAWAADEKSQTYFLEINFRDQWDMACAFVAPSLARDLNKLPRDGGNGVAVFKQPTQIGNHFVTEEGKALKDHLDSIAVIETGDPHYGVIHGHEAACALRSPGRSQKGGNGRPDMGTYDKRPSEGGQNGNVTLYSSTPTPAVLHNHWSKKNDAALGNGMIIRSSVRSGTHTFYHHSANLSASSQPNRFFSEKDLFNFLDKSQPKPATDVLSLYSKDILEMMKKLDTRFLKEIQMQGDSSDAHIAALALAAKSPKAALKSSDLRLNDEDNRYWTDGIPGQFRCSDESKAESCIEEKGTLNLGKICSYVAKLFKSGTCRTIAIDFDYWDIHAPRDDKILSSQGRQMAYPLARLIKELKDAGIYERTVIAMYTLDGSRSPRRDSTGELTKNSIVLAGGGIKGGYYGDIRIEGDRDIYYRPDDNGNPIAGGDSIPGSNEGSYEARLAKMKRVPSRDIFRTVTTAMGIPDKELDPFPDAKPGKVLSYMLKK